jgi:hypothetical protein
MSPTHACPVCGTSLPNRLWNYTPTLYAFRDVRCQGCGTWLSMSTRSRWVAGCVFFVIVMLPFAIKEWRSWQGLPLLGQQAETWEVLLVVGALCAAALLLPILVTRRFGRYVVWKGDNPFRRGSER